ncbi:MAG: polysaccharide biosynthesis protein [Gammaproteobacteria bacterium]
MNVFFRRSTIIIHDLCMVIAALSFAYLIRYNFTLSAINWNTMWQILPVVLAAQGIVFWGTGLYRGLWRFASIPDLWNIVRGAFIGVLAISLTLFLFNRLEGIPRTILVFYPLNLVFLLGAPRLIYRIWKEHGLILRKSVGIKRVLVVGAGRAGEVLVRDMHREGEYEPVGFLDDNKHLKGTKVRGLSVLGTIDVVPEITKKLGVDIVMIAMPSAKNSQMQRVVEYCERAEVPFRTLPRLHDLVSGQSALNNIREVALEDLLGREPVSLDWEGISKGIVGKVVLVSGGGGSIGSELCRQIARLGPAKLVIFEQSEFNLYSIEIELQKNFPNLVLAACLGDVCDASAVENVFNRFHPDLVFHAAAYKHVPMLENQAREAVRNNVLGTRLMAQAANKYGCKSFVMISTDKAVNPANVMGASKRVSEVYCQTLNKHSDTHYITVRFGNVLGSAGSVVPLFKKQVAAGGPITVTHPEITRYFMTIPEATQLILQAAAMGNGGEIFVLEMGEPVKIRYLAEQLIRLSGKEPGEEIEIEYTGLRPGEKLYEELFYDQENLVPTEHDKILLAKSCDAEWEVLNEKFDGIQKACDRYDEQEIRVLLDHLVPELSEQQVVTRNNIIEFGRYQA